MIYDCRKKETLEIKRKGGDLEILIEDLNGKTIYTGWYKMKKPYQKTFSKIQAIFNFLENDLLICKKEEK